jgi:hypothetical protein
MMRHRSKRFISLAGIVAAAVAALATTGCVPDLVHVGYTPSGKVWYHWRQSSDGHTIIVCDVQADGSETNCVESEM